MALLVGNVNLPDDVEAYAGAVAGMLKLPVGHVTAVHLIRRSLDARKHPPLRKGVFKVEVRDEAGVLRRAIPSVRAWTDRDDARYGLGDAGAPQPMSVPTGARAIVVGAGPAGLFAALWLAEAGLSVLLLDRGGPTEDRVPAVNDFWRRRVEVDPENNLLFGEGGAGTFSDGKIYTRRRDGEIGYVLRRFVDFGADPSILEEGWAHLGTDRVRAILPVFRARLAALGAEVRYHARVDDLIVTSGRCRGVVLADGTRETASAVVMAPGHSARDTVRMLVSRGARVERRAVAIGARIEHPQAVIDDARYGHGARGDLPAASYRLAWHPPEGPKARTFCMCPGGMVVPAMNAPGRVVVNGMSFAAQRAYWANAAVIVELGPEVYGGGEDPLAGYAWQDAIERAAFEAGGGDHSAPAQRVIDLQRGQVSASLPRSSYPLGLRAADLRTVLPAAVVGGMLAAIDDFARQVRGFAGEDALLIAPETRTTSPVGFLRTEHGESLGLPGLFPSGEGAGWGGGIVSCAIDGVKTARGVVATLPHTVGVA
ncbi:MAG: hypothetical protein RLZZ383_492 [Pseudomonadota bacterium]